MRVGTPFNKCRTSSVCAYFPESMCLPNPDTRLRTYDGAGRLSRREWYHGQTEENESIHPKSNQSSATTSRRAKRKNRKKTSNRPARSSETKGQFPYRHGSGKTFPMDQPVEQSCRARPAESVHAQATAARSARNKTEKKAVLLGRKKTAASFTQTLQMFDCFSIFS